MDIKNGAIVVAERKKGSRFGSGLDSTQVATIAPFIIRLRFIDLAPVTGYNKREKNFFF